MLSQLWSNGQAQEIDRLSCLKHANVAQDLMEEAGRAVFRKVVLLRRPYQKILILAGPGNNGGDALVAGRLLFEAGFPVEVMSVCPQAESPLRQVQRARCESIGLSLTAYPGSMTVFPRSTFLIDGICGLGLREPLRPGLLRDALVAAAQIKAETVLAIDLPSGQPADRWASCEAPLEATHTVTFGALKPAHRLAPAAFASGEITCIPLAFDPEVIAQVLKKGPELWESDDRGSGVWSHLGPDAHKYTRGHVLVIGGSAGKVGACYLAGEAAMRTGCGWVSVAALSPLDQPARPSFLTYENWSSINPQTLSPFITQRRVKALLIGPGTMDNPLNETTLRFLAACNREQGLGLIFDAGALRGLAPLLQGLRFEPTRTLLTPHPGEWLALHSKHQPLDTLSGLAPAWEFCEAAGITVFYKASHPFTLSRLGGQQRLTLTSQGDNRLAKAGSGDVLAGTALALLAAGVSAAEVGHLAQNRVAAAAQLAAKEYGYNGLTPLDIVQKLGRVRENI